MKVQSNSDAEKKAKSDSPKNLDLGSVEVNSGAVTILVQVNPDYHVKTARIWGHLLLS